MRLRNREKMLSRAPKGFIAIALLSLTLCAAIARAQQPTPAQPAATAQSAAAPAQSSPQVAPSPVTSPEPADSQPGTPINPIQRGATGQFTLRANAYEVRLNATVLDGSGRTIQTLDKNAFRVFEDNVPQTIAGFRHEDLPV